MSSGEYGQLVEFLGRQFAEVGRQFAEVDRRFDAMDLRRTQMIAELRQEMLGHFDAIYRRFERLEQEYQATAAQHRNGDEASIGHRLSDVGYPVGGISPHVLDVRDGTMSDRPPGRSGFVGRPR